MSLSPPEYIRHMLDEIDYILNRISNMDYEINSDRETAASLRFAAISRPVNSGLAQG